MNPPRPPEVRGPINPFADDKTAANKTTEQAGQPAGTFRREVHTDNYERIERDLSEGEQLLQLGKLEGRCPVRDAVAGRTVWARLDEIADSDRDPNKRISARELKNELNERFNEIAPAKLTIQPAEK